MTEPIDYTAAYSQAVFYSHPEPGYLRISGPDRVAFLQRQITNDLSLLGPDLILQAVLTSPIGRILDVFTLLVEPEAIIVLPLPGHGAAAAKYLQSRIFFMDQVVIAEASTDFAQIVLFGPEAEHLLRRLELALIPEKDHVSTGSLAGSAVRVLGLRGLRKPGYYLIAPNAAATALEGSLLGAGAVRLTPESYNILRVEAGAAAGDHELIEDYTPFEAGLDKLVAENKGCYTGQEVLARQRNYDKITRYLTGLRLSLPAAPRAAVLKDGKPVGTLTSTALSPRYGPIALAILRRASSDSDLPLEIGTESGKISAVVSDLPFR